jgi:hypothetical protein
VLTTSGGFQSINCTGPTITGSSVSGPGTAFTGCSNPGGLATTTVGGAALTQPASVSAINLAVFQPGSSFNYRLDAVPRAFSSVGISGVGGAGIGAPALLTLGGADTVQGGPNNSQLIVNGNVNINNGSLSCTGGPYVNAYGFGAVSGTLAFNPPTCATGGPTTTQQAIPDPYSNVVSNLTFPSLPKNPGGCAPGEYTTPIVCSSLSPGLYKLDQGIGNADISCPGCVSSGQGVLLYLTGGTFSTNGNQSINLPGLTVRQSAQFFHTTALQGLVVWQDKVDTLGATIKGTSNVAVAQISLAGTLYFPSANVAIQGGGNGLNISTGRIIAKSISTAGSGQTIISP